MKWTKTRVINIYQIAMTEFVTKKVVNTYGDGQLRGHYCGIKKKLIYILTVKILGVCFSFFLES